MSEPHGPLPETPPEVMALAKVRLEAGDCQGALDMLREPRDAFGSVPPAYDALIGRCWLRLGEGLAAVNFLTTARDKYGDRMPVEQRRDLGAALFAVGRIEAAGRELGIVAASGARVVRPAWRAAIEAYAHRLSDDLDRAPATLYRVIAQAEALFDAKDFAAARDLLVAARAQYGGAGVLLPAAFDALFGRILFRCGERDLAIEHLTRARDAGGADVPLSTRQPLGTALFEVGRIAEAGRELDLAVRAGAVLSRVELLMATNAYRAHAGDPERLDTSFARGVTVADPDRHLAYLWVPKNATSLLKAGLVLSSRHRDAFLASGKTIHAFCTALSMAATAPDVGRDPAYFRFTVLREPLRRILSAYLDKIVHGGQATDEYMRLQVARTVRAAQAALGLPDDPGRSITFEEFVRYLTKVEDFACDLHWMPQVRLVGTDLGRYAHVGTVERLADTLDLLSSRFAYVVPASGDPNLDVRDPHVTKFSETASLPAPHRAVPAELASLANGVPMPEFFLTQELKDLLTSRYRADLDMYESLNK